MDVGELNRRRLYTRLGLDYTVDLGCGLLATFALRAISAVAEILVLVVITA